MLHIGSDSLYPMRYAPSAHWAFCKTVTRSTKESNDSTGNIRRF
jgi:hypothetical protein